MSNNQPQLLTRVRGLGLEKKVDKSKLHHCLGKCRVQSSEETSTRPGHLVISHMSQTRSTLAPPQLSQHHCYGYR